MKITELYNRETALRVLMVLIMTACFAWAISTISVNTTVNKKIKEASPCANLTTAECAYKLLKALPASQRHELGITEHRIQRLRKQANRERRIVIRTQQQKAVSKSPTRVPTPLPKKPKKPLPQSSHPTQAPTATPAPSQAPTPPPAPQPKPILKTPSLTVPPTALTPPLTVPSLCVPRC